MATTHLSADQLVVAGVRIALNLLLQLLRSRVYVDLCTLAHLEEVLRLDELVEALLNGPLHARVDLKLLLRDGLAREHLLHSCCPLHAITRLVFVIQGLAQHLSRETSQ